MNLRSTLVFALFFSLFVLVLSLSIKENKTNSKNISYCNQLTYAESLKIHPNNFSSINIEINFVSEKEWRRSILSSLIKSKKIKKDEIEHFTRTNRSSANINFSLPGDFNCTLKAEIRPHGKLSDHRDGSGLPSLNVNLKEGHIFGITKFILFRPHTRGYDNEIIVTNILKELDFLAPRTSSVKVTYNNEKSKFIFQERFVKELLEHNSIKEGPMYEGDGRFFYFLPEEKYNFIKHKVSNDKLIKKSDNHLAIAQKGISILNKVNQSNVKNLIQYPNSTADYYTLGEKVLDKNYFDRLLVFDSLNYAMDASHGLSSNDRVLYFDTVYDKFQPIYYDGTPGLLDKDNKIINKKSIGLEKLTNTDKSSQYGGRVVPSAVNGAKKALDLINKIDLNRLNKKLNRNGVNTNSKTTKEIVDQIITNLKSLEKLNKKRIFPIQASLNASSKIDSLSKISSTNKRLVYNIHGSKNYLVCDFSLRNCQNSKFKKDSVAKLINQSLSDEDENHLIYLGREFKDNKEGKWIHEDEDIKKVLKFENFNVLINGDITFKVDDENKKITIIKQNNYGNIVFYKGSLEDWKINFISTSQLKTPYPGIDSNNLTGCLNFYDIEIKNISLNISNTNCEDAVNFVRSNGEIKTVTVENSAFDSIDADFSNLFFQNININKSLNDCIDFSFGNYEVKNSNLNHCGDKAVSVGEKSKLKIMDLKVTHSKSGVVSKDYSETNINNSLISNIEYCYQAYNKKNEFSGGYLKIKNSSCKNSQNKFFIDKMSLINIENEL